MITHTTYTLATKLSRTLDIGLKRVAVCNGDHLLGRLKEKGYTQKDGKEYKSGKEGGEDIDIKHGGKFFFKDREPSEQQREFGFKEYLPAMSIIKNTVTINKERTRIQAARMGMFIDANMELGIATKIHIIPVIVNYNITVLFQDSEMLDSAEMNLIWALESGAFTQLPVKLVVSGKEVELPCTISPSARGVEFSRNYEYSWEAAKLYRTDLAFDVYTFLVRSHDVPIIKYANYKTFIDEDILLGELIIEYTGDIV
jgi:hypothetical protein